MKIKSVKADVVKHTIPPGGPERHGARGSIVLVKVETDEKITGIGDAMTHSLYHEAGLSVKKLIEKGLSNLLIGENPLEIRRLWRKMHTNEMYGRQRGLAMNAISAVDTALMDIAGKKWNVPIHKLLGGKERDRVRVYASDIFDMENPENTVELVTDLVDEGFTGIKLGYGGFGLEIDESVKMIERVRDAVGYDANLMVDGPLTLTLPEAVNLGRRLEEYDIFWWEEPLPKTDLKGYIELSRKLDLNVAAGEQLQTAYEFKEWILNGAVNVIQPDMQISGGLSEGRRIADLAEIWNTILVPHSWSTAINFTAALHLVASLSRGLFVEYRTTPTVLMSDILKNPPEIRDGYVKIPSKPGLGIELNNEVIEEYKIREGEL